MSFVLPNGARKFFRTLLDRSPGGTRFIMFDAYYTCLLLGLQSRRLGPDEELESDRFVENYPDDYKPQADFIAGLLIDAELDRRNVDIRNKQAVEREMILLLDPSSSTGLSVDGGGLLNRYAAGGFALIEQEMTPPAKLEDLIVKYASMWPASEGDH